MILEIFVAIAINLLFFGLVVYLKHSGFGKIMDRLKKTREFTVSEYWIKENTYASKLFNASGMLASIYRIEGKYPFQKSYFGNPSVESKFRQQRLIGVDLSNYKPEYAYFKYEPLGSFEVPYFENWLTKGVEHGRE